ncbi:MAG: type II toxin-antitoxin system RelE/ParE family toxin [Nitrospira sp.]|nr:type II toxin-antitoxin system RelE/ParE family toxin [Nitrospira sp.]
MKKYRVEWSRAASTDLLNIIDYISEDSTTAAISIFEKMRSKCETLSQSPERGRVVPELKEYGISSYHEIIVKPWRIIYRVSDNKIYVLAVIDSRRNIEDILIERFLE